MFEQGYKRLNLPSIDSFSSFHLCSSSCSFSRSCAPYRNGNNWACLICPSTSEIPFRVCAYSSHQVADFCSDLTVLVVRGNRQELYLRYRPFRLVP
ncbi:hypothetical protein NPIL_333171 [Nephila pilipes]|uniref:Uncharacterized protein n=1 Tax=Nephila pilipes TaxID=299642 RepID=A0A8X6TI44_NEPPI|nr:hypothetical protein NPIL_333171 [Nephila pilipes]